MRKYIVNPISMFIIGLILGFLCKMLDIYTYYLGQIFSEITIWILFGVLISIYSKTKKWAMVNVFLFCIGMLISYYVTAEVTHSVYGQIYIEFWTFFSFLAAIFAYFTWLAIEKGTFPKIIRIGITCVCVLSGFLFQELEIHDLIIDLIIIYFLFIKKNIRV